MQYAPGGASCCPDPDSNQVNITMQQSAAPCHSFPAQLHEIQKATGTPGVTVPHTNIDHGIAEPSQWLAHSPCRDARSPYAWMQSVLWARTARLHPRFSDLTVQLAAVLAELTPCRPGVEYLMRRLNRSRRCVQYHLSCLRETGLLVYVVKGTRRRGMSPLASEFCRSIPPAFDHAVGVITTGLGFERRVTGCSEPGRKLLGKLGTKVKRWLRRRPRPCTPMGGTTGRSSSAGLTSTPLKGTSPTAPQNSPRSSGSPVRRRFRLATQLIERVPWLHRASLPRIAWVVGAVADAGWTVDEVVAWLNLQTSPERVTRPSGFLARRLQGATAIWPTEAGRQRALEADRNSATSRRNRQADYGYLSDRQHLPSALVSLVADGIRQGRAKLALQQAHRGLDVLDPDAPPSTDPGLPVPEGDWDATALAFEAALASTSGAGVS